MSQPIEIRLHASIEMDAINGDDYERSVMLSQCIEAVSEIIELRRRVELLTLYLDEIRQDRATMRNPVQDTETT